MSAVLMGALWPCTEAPLYDVDAMDETSHDPAQPDIVSQTEAPLDHRRRRMLFRANHRGTHENDLLIGGYVTPRIGAFSDDELDRLEIILELPDPLLADWLTGRLPIPPGEDQPTLRAIRDAALARHAQ